MNPNNDPASNWRGVPYRDERKRQVEEKTLQTATVQVERKTFTLVLKENPRGRFLRITEEAKGRRNAIIIPAAGLDDFVKACSGMAQSAAESEEATS